MQLKNGNFSDMAADIKANHKKIVMFGAGVIGTVTTPEILSQYGLQSSIHCYLDNDKQKWGQNIQLGSKTIPICSPDCLEALGQEVIILINISRYAEVLEQLEQRKYTEHTVCYIIPIMCIGNFHRDGGQGLIMESDTPLIPKTLHYMWLGKRDIPKNLQICLDSWRKHCPDYEIVRWDESNYDVTKNQYMKQAYERGKYGFVPDYARFDILYRYGGIYMDTDVEVIRSLDPLLHQQAFCGVEKWQVVNFGGCSGAVKGHRSLEHLLEAREKIRFTNADGSCNMNTCGYYDTRVFLDHGYEINGRNQTILGMNVYTYDYFHPYDYMSGRMELTDDTFTVHHFNGGWLDDTMRMQNRRTAEAYEAICNRTQIAQSERN